MTALEDAKHRLRRLRASLMDHGPYADVDDIRAVLDALDAAERERDEALAVIERALSFTDNADLPVNSMIVDTRRILLATTPADALRQVKAEAWDEGRESVALDFTRPPDEAGMRKPTPNPYRIEKGEQSGSLQDLGGGVYRVPGARVDPQTGRYITNASDIEKGEQK